jgi:dTDP-4-dehydrorhamnose 3,5-epimerase-like enzyme
MPDFIQNQPRLIQFKKVGHPAEGYISIAEIEKELPFAPKRVFWTYFTPHEVIRGRHAHYRTEMVLIAVSGRIELQTEMAGGIVQNFLLDHPETGVYMPPHCWHTMQYSHNAVQLVFASTAYDPDDYIRSYDAFRAL